MFKRKNDEINQQMDFAVGSDIELKGTLTILDNSHIVLGLPSNYRSPISKAAMQIFSDQALEWLKNGGVLPISFPVDVIDLRKREWGEKEDG